MAETRGEPGSHRSDMALFLAVLAGLTLLHVVLATLLPLSGDEAYYWDCSRHLDWSYFDQPPLVIWAMVPFRAVLGESRLAVRAPAVLASLVLGLALLDVTRRLGGGPREATAAYLLLHTTPLVFLGSFYASTDVVMTAAFVAAAGAAAAVAQGEARAWPRLGLAVGLGFLAKFPALLALAALAPALARRQLRSGLQRSPWPWLAGLLAAALTVPVWVWGAQHGWSNLAFQLRDRHRGGAFTLRYMAELVGVNLLLVTPFLAVALAVAWWLGWRRRDGGWQAVLVATAAPLVFFSLVGLRSRVAPHWVGPGLVLAVVPLVLIRFGLRRWLIVAGAATGLLLSAGALWVVSAPLGVLDLHWSYRGRPVRVSTDKLAAAVGNDRLVAETVLRRRPHELVASESYTTVHLLAFLSGGELPTRLAHVKPGKHGLASLYWYRPQELVGRDVLFVTEKRQVDARLRDVFAEVEELEPLQIEHLGRVVRSVRFLRCRDLRHPEGVFTRLADRSPAPRG